MELPLTSAPRRFAGRARLGLLLAVIGTALTTGAPAAGAHSTTVHHDSPPAGCPNADTPATRAPIAVTRAAVLCLVNEQRADHRLRALAPSSQLNRSATDWSAAMVRQRGFGHSDAFVGRIQAAGLRIGAAGENLATGYPTPRAAVSAWMSSGGHCRNILSPTYTLLGVGVSPHPVAGFASGGATWTQDFALPAGHHAPSGNFGPADGCPSGP